LPITDPRGASAAHLSDSRLAGLHSFTRSTILAIAESPPRPPKCRQCSFSCDVSSLFPSQVLFRLQLHYLVRIAAGVPRQHAVLQSKRGFAVAGTGKALGSAANSRPRRLSLCVYCSREDESDFLWNGECL
jgi:hypothetical protein